MDDFENANQKRHTFLNTLSAEQKFLYYDFVLEKHEEQIKELYKLTNTVFSMKKVKKLATYVIFFASFLTAFKVGSEWLTALIINHNMNKEHTTKGVAKID